MEHGLFLLFVTNRVVILWKAPDREIFSFWNSWEKCLRVLNLVDNSILNSVVDWSLIFTSHYELSTMSSDAEGRGYQSWYQELDILQGHVDNDLYDATKLVKFVVLGLCVGKPLVKRATKKNCCAPSFKSLVMSLFTACVRTASSLKELWILWQRTTGQRGPCHFSIHILFNCCAA